MSDINAKERFRSIMHFKEVDRIPVWDLEGFSEQAMRLWCSQGLPLGVNVAEYVGFDPKLPIYLGTSLIPNFIPKTIASYEKSVTETDCFGFTVRRMKNNSVTPQVHYYLKGPVDSRADWERMKKRYDPTDIRRYGTAWGQELLDYYRDTDSPTFLFMPWGPGRGIKNGYTLGFDRFMDVLIHEPEFIEDMLEFWSDFLIKLVKPLVEQVKIDLFLLNEDGIAYKNSTFISPTMYKRLWFPHLRRLCDYLRSHGIEFIGHYASGNIKPLVPVLMEAGINLFAPLEVAAGMDVRELRAEYGKEILLMGNIGRAALMSGVEAVDKEFEGKVPTMMKGGYIPAVDDFIMPDISFESYMHYIRLVKEWRPWTARC